MSEFRRRLMLREIHQNNYTPAVYITIKNTTSVNGLLPQFINTDCIVKNTDEIYLEIEPLEEININNANNTDLFGWALGAWNEPQQCLIRNYYNSSYPFSFWYGSANESALSNEKRCQIFISPNDRIIQYNRISVDPNKTDYTFTNAYPNGDSNIPPYIGMCNWGGKGDLSHTQGGNLRVYEYYVKDKNGNYKIHLKPAIDSNNRFCMVDLVSGKLFYDSNGRELGGAVCPFDEISFIESDGNQLIELDYCPNPKTNIYAYIEFVENPYSYTDVANNTIMGAPADDTAVFSINNGGAVNQAYQYYIWNIKSYADGGKISQITEETHERTYLAWLPNSFTLNTKIVYLDYKNNVNQNKFKIFGANVPYNRFNFRVYSFQIVENKQILLDLVPVRTPQGSGLYDIINNKLYLSILDDFITP